MLMKPGTLRFWHPDAAGGPDTRVRPQAVNFSNPAGDKAGGGSGFADWSGGVTPPDGVPEDIAPPKKAAKEAKPAPADRTRDNGEGTTDPAPRPPKAAPATETTGEPGDESEPDEGVPESGTPEEGEEPDGEGFADPAESEVAGILAKYGGDTGQLGKAYLEIQRLATAKGKEAKELREHLSRKIELIDHFFEQDEDGGFSLRPEVAMAALTEERMPLPVDERAIRRQAADEVRKYLADTLQIEGEDLADAMERSKGRIDEIANSRIKAETEKWQNHRSNQIAKATRMADKFFASNPSARKVAKSIDKWYARIPQSIRHVALLENWLPLAEIAQIETIRSNFDSAVREAFQKGVSVGKKGEVEPTLGSRPTSGARAPMKSGAGTGGEYVQRRKAGILKAGSLPSIFD